MSLIAGHEMVETSTGRHCAGCGISWRTLVDMRERWRIGEPGIAHMGDLNNREVSELEAEWTREQDAMARVLGW